MFDAASDMLTLQHFASLAEFIGREGQGVEHCATVLEDGFEYQGRRYKSLSAIARAITFQLAEVAVSGPMVRAILAAIRRVRAPPSCA